MQPERWHRVDDILQAALALQPAERSAFVDSACDGDESLRDEVISLLSLDPQTLDLIDTPALEVAAPLLASDQPDLSEGQLLGHYRILSLLGIGGMGEVYLAKDERLNRLIALKLLPDDYTREKDRLRRFQQEAQAASALNHPNILTIYELGEVDGQQFIATEFVEGETLRQRMKRGELSLSEALDVTIQTAGALAAAHKAGIVHRDIKPENIMLRPDGYVKVLDFGLAKLTEQQESTSRTRTMADVNISSGLLMGTVKYMSPEQAQGLSVDARSDIFSLGVVLYEMLTGRTPFKGENAKELIARVLREEPPALNHYLPEAPKELQQVLDKALHKDRDERYQAVADIASDLKNLQRKLDIPTGSRHSIQSGLAATTALYPSSGTFGIGGVTALSSASTAEYLITEIKQHKTEAVIALTAIIVFMAGIAFSLFRLTERNRSAVAPLQTMTLARLTTTGKTTATAISPDGKHIAYLSDDSGQQSIWVKQLATSSDVRIVEPIQTGRITRQLMFSRDGNYLYYRVRDAKTTVINLYRVPVQGGDSLQVIVDVDSPVTFSSDGKRLAFARHNNPVVGESYLLTADADGTNERIISTRKVLDGFISPTWSPDGKMLACAVGLREPTSLIVVPVEGGEVRPVGAQKWRLVDQLSWVSGGDALVLSAQDHSSAQMQIWQVSYPSGEARRVTNDLNSYAGMSVTADSNKMAIVQSALQSDLWIMPSENASQAVPITSHTGKNDGSNGFSWTPDGKLIYASDASGNLDLWSIAADGSNPKQLTSNAGQNYEPAVTSDGRYIVFVSDRAGGRNLWRMNVDGTEPMQLTTSADHFPTCSSDSRWIVYTAASNSGTVTLWRIGIDGSQPVQLTDKWATTPTISPDGKWIAFHYWAYQNEGPHAFMSLLPFEGGQATNLGALGDTALFRWTPDGTAVAYVDEQKGVSNIRTMPLDGGPSKQLTDFKSDQIFWFDWSRDGKQLALARGTQTSDVVMISNFR